MSEEWGPWTEHDGKGCPCVGEYGQVEVHLDEDGGEWQSLKPISNTVGEGVFVDDGSWHWHEDWFPIIRYRIRKPRGLTILEGVLRETELEDA